MKKYYLTFIFSFFIIASLCAQSPYAYYPLQGNGNDTTSNHFNGTIRGPLVLGTDQYGQTDGAMMFDGDSNYIILPTNFDLPYRTVITWFKATTVSHVSTENVIYMSDNSNIQYGMTNICLYDSGNYVLQFGVNCDQFFWIIPADTNIWYQAVVVRSPSFAKLFVNGALVDSASGPNNTHSTNQTTYNAVIGADRELHNLFTGLIDDVEIYDTILSDQQVTGNYTAVTEIHQIDAALKTYAQSGNIYVQIPDACSNDIRSVALYDASGKEITSKPSIQFNGRLNDGPLAAGTYIVAVYTNNAQKPASRKVVVTN